MTEPSIKASTKTVSGLAKACTSSPIKISTWALGKMIASMAMGSIFTQTVINTRESFKKESKKDEVSTFIDPGPPMKEIGKTTRKVALELSFIPIKKSTLGDGLMDKSMDMESMNTKTETNMTANGSKTKRTGLEFCTTKVEPVTTVNGLTIRPAIMESSLTSTRMCMKVFCY